MTEYDRKIVATFDLDGPKMFYPTIIPPSRTAKELFQGELELPPRGILVPSRLPQSGLQHYLLALGTSIFHQIRPVNKEAVLSVYRLMHIAHNTYNREIECNVLTAREQDLWHVTEKKLQKEGLMEIFKEVHLNPGFTAASWKENKIESLIDSNPDLDKTSYIHFDDDLRAGLSVARINERFPGEWKVISYVFRNFSNREFLLNRGKPREMRNLIFVDSFDEALHDIWQKIHEEKI